MNFELENKVALVTGGSKNIGKEKAFTIFSKGTSWVRKDNFFTFIKETLFKFKKELAVITLLVLIAFLFLF